MTIKNFQIKQTYGIIFASEQAYYGSAHLPHRVKDMPNHITNHVIFKGDEKLLKLIRKLMDSKEKCEVQNFGADGKIETLHKYIDNVFNFQSVVPMPESERYNSYDWRIENWGTKWNSYELGDVYLDNNELMYSFSTAWSPPIPVIQKLSTIFSGVEIEHKFIDEGWGFAAEQTWKAGTMIGEIEYNCQHNDPSFRAFYHQMYGEYPEGYEDDYENEEGLDDVKTESSS